ncbi:LolA-related protein [Thiocapsa sp.]|uniref:LolA family protein n=1 Tax=Thiocapsa sp. TaxID=2024551 RepID=UPI0025E5C581|nr:LolA-related protein [Thiocapsa sp.]
MRTRQAAVSLLLGLCSACIAIAAAAGQPADVQALMQRLGRVERVEVAYQERVESGLIDTAIGTRGNLVYQTPDRIRRISDDGNGFALVGERMQIIRGNQVVDALLVSEIEPLAALVGALRATFAGDLAALRADYRLDYGTTEQAWTLDLAPRAMALSPLFQRVRIIGDGATIETIEMLEANGDRRTLQMQLLAREPTGLE